MPRGYVAVRIIACLVRGHAAEISLPPHEAKGGAAVARTRPRNAGPQR
jgi:hypothetical protein